MDAGVEEETKATLQLLGEEEEIDSNTEMTVDTVTEIRRKKKRRGTRGKGRKINYKKVCDEKNAGTNINIILVIS